MRTIGSVLSAQPERPPRRSTRRYRKGVGFVLDVSRHCTKLDRNDKAKLLVACEAMERATKRKGCRNGVISIPGMILLRCLLLRFHGPSGLCCPSIETLASVTGLCKQSVVNGLARLEACGVLQITRRLQRYRDQLGNVAVRQGSNLYSFKELPAMVQIFYARRNSSCRHDKRPRVHDAGGNHKQVGFRPSERAEPARPELQIGSLGDLASVMMKRLTANPPDWRASARLMLSHRDA